MLPLRDNIPTRRFAVVTVAIIVVNFAVWLLWEKAGMNPGFTQAVVKGSYFPCEVQGTCAEHGYSWPANVFISMFQHAGWEHILGNMLFLWIFGNNVEDTLGRLRFIGFYLAGGVVATAVQTFITLEFGSARDAAVPNLGASGAIAAVLGAYFVLLPWGRVLTFVIPFFFFELPAMVFLGIWFLFQLVDGGFSFVQPQPGGGVAFFAHIGGFLFGALTVKLWATGRPRPLRPAYS